VLHPSTFTFVYSSLDPPSFPPVSLFCHSAPRRAAAFLCKDGWTDALAFIFPEFSDGIICNRFLLELSPHLGPCVSLRFFPVSSEGDVLPRIRHPFSRLRLLAPGSFFPCTRLYYCASYAFFRRSVPLISLFGSGEPGTFDPRPRLGSSAIAAVFNSLDLSILRNFGDLTFYCPRL